MKNIKKYLAWGSSVLILSIFLAGCQFGDSNSNQNATDNPKNNTEKNETLDDLTVSTNKNSQGQEQKNPSSPAGQNTNSKQPPTMQIDKSKKYSAVLKTTEGNITIELNAEVTPITVNNFATLARDNFYDETIFHRVIKGFMIQGGDPNGDGTGGPGYKFADEPFEGEYTRGTVAMANSGPNTNGSQFFIMHKDYNLPRNYVIFGKVSDGLDIVDKIAEAPVETSRSGESSKPINAVKVNSVEIIEQ